MPYLLAGFVILVALLLASRWFAQTNPQLLAVRMRTVGGIACMVAAGLLMTRGMAVIAGPLAALGAFLFFGRGGSGGPSSGSQTPGLTSRVVTDHLEMELDHDTGAMQGRVLKGEFFGREISEMTPADLAKLWQECRFADPQSAELIAAYLDNTHASWRDDMAGDGGAEDAETADAGAGAGGGGAGPATGITLDEAYDVLGLDRSADADDVRRAHRNLMQKMHPDHGGSTYLASKINAAKELLLSRMMN